MTILLSNQSRVIGIRSIQPKQMKAEALEDTETSSSFHDAQQRANDIMLHAQQKAAQAMKEAEEHIETLTTQFEEEKQQWIENAKQEGYKAGFEEGERVANQANQAKLNQANNVIKLSEQEYVKRVEESEEAILQLGLTAASKIIHQALEEDPSRYVSIVRSLIEEVKEQETIQLLVHPDYYQLVIEQKEELQLLVQQRASLTIHPEGSLEPSQCYVESSYGRIDASVDSQLKELRTILSQLLEEDKESERESIN